jgi:hypothetical protein
MEGKLYIRCSGLTLGCLLLGWFVPKDCYC